MQTAEQFGLGEVVQWLGVAVGLMGVLAAAPAGVALLVRETRQQMLGLLSRLFPNRFRRGGQSSFGLMSDHIGIFDQIAAGSSLGHWSEMLSLDEKAALLHRQVNELVTRVETLEQEFAAKHSELDQRVTVLAEQIAELASSLSDRLDQMERQAAQFDARGLVGIGLGILMTGIPIAIAANEGLGVLIVAGALLWTAGTLGRFIPEVERLSRVEAGES